jgi:hypothetical protein
MIRLTESANEYLAIKQFGNIVHCQFKRAKEVEK